MSKEDHLVIEFDAHDLKQLTEIFRAARAEVGEELRQGDIIAACRQLLVKAQRAGAPNFVLSRLGRLEELVGMVEDPDWQLPQEDVTRVINALAYFANAKDLIPDDVPGLGYLDDAVMVDLVVRELSSEIKAFRDFCNYRESEAQKRMAAGDKRPVTRLDWLTYKRQKADVERREARSWLPWKRKSRSFLDD
jgi:uncharacterized membrane protein YkvA (DUF1232 family)